MRANRQLDASPDGLTAQVRGRVVEVARTLGTIRAEVRYGQHGTSGACRLDGSGIGLAGIEHVGEDQEPRRRIPLAHRAYRCRQLPGR
jgi:hypothetical protein